MGRDEVQVGSTTIHLPVLSTTLQNLFPNSTPEDLTTKDMNRALKQLGILAETNDAANNILSLYSDWAKGESEDEDLEEGMYVIESVKKHRKYKGRIQYLIKWKGYSDDENTWEPESSLGSALEVLEAYRNLHGLSKNEGAAAATPKPTKKKLKRSPDTTIAPPPASPARTSVPSAPSVPSALSAPSAPPAPVLAVESPQSDGTTMSDVTENEMVFDKSQLRGDVHTDGHVSLIEDSFKIVSQYKSAPPPVSQKYKSRLKGSTDNKTIEVSIADGDFVDNVLAVQKMHGFMIFHTTWKRPNNDRVEAHVPHSLLYHSFPYKLLEFYESRLQF